MLKLGSFRFPGGALRMRSTLSSSSIRVIHQMDQLHLGSHPLVAAMIALKADNSVALEASQREGKPQSMPHVLRLEDVKKLRPMGKLVKDYFVPTQPSGKLGENHHTIQTNDLLDPVDKPTDAGKGCGANQEDKVMELGALKDGWLTRSSVATFGVQTLAILRFFEENAGIIDATTIVGVLNKLVLSVVDPGMRKLRLPPGTTKCETDGSDGAEEEEDWGKVKRHVFEAVKDSLDKRLIPGRKKALKTNPVFIQLMNSVAASLPLLSPRDLSTLCLTLKVFQIKDEVLLTKLYQAIGTSLQEFNVIDLNIAFHSLTTLVGWDMPRTLAREFLASAASHLHLFSPQDLSNFTWSVAKQKLAEPEIADFLVALEGQINERVPNFLPQEISVIMYSFAALDHRPAHLFELFEAHWAPRLKEFSPQGLGNVTWAHGKLGFKCRDTLLSLSRQVSRQAEKLEPQNVSNIIWALGKLEWKDEELLKALVHQVIGKLRHFSNQGLANTAWGLAQLGRLNQELSTQIQMQAADRLVLFRPAEVSTLLWALAKAKSKLSGPFPEMVASVVKEKLTQLSPQNIAVVTSSLTTLGVQDPQLDEQLLKVIFEDLSKFSSLELANLNWALNQKNPIPRNLVDQISGALVQRALVTEKTKP